LAIFQALSGGIEAQFAALGIRSRSTTAEAEAPNARLGFGTEFDTHVLRQAGQRATGETVLSINAHAVGCHRHPAFYRFARESELVPGRRDHLCRPFHAQTAVRFLDQFTKNEFLGIARTTGETGVEVTATLEFAYDRSAEGITQRLAGGSNPSQCMRSVVLRCAN
jgi:hypothetical protein